MDFFVRKTHPFFKEKHQLFERFENSYIFIALVVQLSYFQRFLKKGKSFFKKPIYVFSKKPKFRTFWEIFLIQLQSASKWLLLVVSKKTQDFLWTTKFFSRRNHFLNVLRSLTISVASYNKFLSLAISKKYFFFEKPLYFFYQNQILKVERSLAFSVAFYGKFFYTQQFF